MENLYYIKCEISNIDQKTKSLYECFNGVKEIEKSNECYFSAK